MRNDERDCISVWRAWIEGDVLGDALVTGEILQQNVRIYYCQSCVRLLFAFAVSTI